jgi:Na+-translocating ferredoxin:NAD+ oxidoreductase RnfD subunit
MSGVPLLAEVAPITGPMYQLFIFFMITDPPTTLSSRRGRIVTAVAVALLEAVLRLLEVVHAPFYALTIVGPSALLIESWLMGRSEIQKERA